MKTGNLCSCLLITLLMICPPLGAETDGFLIHSPSVRANGMGQAGVSLVDNYSVFSNPAGAAVVNNDAWGRFSIYPSRSSDQDGTLSSWSASARLFDRREFLGTRINLGFSFLRTDRTHTPIYITRRPDTQQSAGSIIGDYEDSESTSLIIGFGVSGPVEISSGVSIKSVSLPDYAYVSDASGTAHDVGFLIRMPIDIARAGEIREQKRYMLLLPSIGLSWSNYGLPVSDPKTRRVGASCAVQMIDPGSYGGWRILSAIPSFEWEKLPVTDMSRKKLGIELSFFEAVSLRGGTIVEEGPNPFCGTDVSDFVLDRDPFEGAEEYSLDVQTWGLSVSSRGLSRLIGKLAGTEPDAGGNMFRFLRNRFDITFSVAHSPGEYRSSWGSADNSTICGLTFSY